MSDLEYLSPTDEETDEDYSDSDKAEFGLYQCLPVDDADPNFESDEPLTVEEYLRRVRYEAKSLPNVTRSAVPTKREEMSTCSRHAPLGTSLSLVPCDTDRKPSIIWIRSFLSHFVSLRKSLESIRASGQRASYCGITEVDLPGIDMLLPLGQVQLHDMLESEVNKLKDLDCLDMGRFTIMYIITALIDLPCHPDILATMRKLARYCAAIRAQEPCPGREQLSMLNLMLTICGGLYKQDEELATVWDEERFGLR